MSVPAEERQQDAALKELKSCLLLLWTWKPLQREYFFYNDMEKVE